MGVRPESLREGKMTEEIRLLLALYAERARIYYEQAARALPPEERRRAAGRPRRWAASTARCSTSSRRAAFPASSGSLRLSKPRRLAIAARTFLGFEGRA